ncbi:hypothetical protein M8J75_011329 [Diaphorina citri]|nr:hypothetical protein M8J75_011329 [Diaphorina citri]
MYFVPSILNKLWQVTGLLPIAQETSGSSAKRQDGKEPVTSTLRWDLKFYLLSATILGVVIVLAVKDIRHYYHVWKNEEIRQFCGNNTGGVYQFRYHSSAHADSISCKAVDEISFMKILNYLLLAVMVTLGIIELNLNFENQIKFYKTVETFQNYFDFSLEN